MPNHHRPVTVNGFVEVDFDYSIKQEPHYKECAKLCLNEYQKTLPENVSPAEFLIKLKKVYNDKKPSTQTNQNNEHEKKKIDQFDVKIPLIIHQMWFGNTLPEIYKIWQKKLKRIHSSWKIINWTENKIRKTFPKGLVNQRIFDQGKKMHNYAKMANIARYEILYKFGGLYLDYDITCFKSFEFLHRLYNFYTGLGPFKQRCSCDTAVIGASKNNPIIKSCIDLITSYDNTQTFAKELPQDQLFEDELNNTLFLTGAKPFTTAINNHLEDDTFDGIVFPQEYFSPVTPTEASLCFHEEHKSWQDRIHDFLYPHHN